MSEVWDIARKESKYHVHHWEVATRLVVRVHWDLVFLRKQRYFFHTMN